VADIPPVEENDLTIKSLYTPTAEDIVDVIMRDPSEEDPVYGTMPGSGFTKSEQVKRLQPLTITERAVILRVRVEKSLLGLAKAAGYDPHPRPSFGRMLKFVLNRYDDLAPFRDSFEVFYRIASQVAHGVDVPFADLQLAVHLGERLEQLILKASLDKDS
jgi:hypothetical protein